LVCEVICSAARPSALICEWPTFQGNYVVALTPERPETSPNSEVDRDYWLAYRPQFGAEIPRGFYLETTRFLDESKADMFIIWAR